MKALGHSAGGRAGCCRDVAASSQRGAQAIQETRLEFDVIFNSAVVLVFPTGVNKAAGMDDALGKLGLSLHKVVGIRDAETIIRSSTGANSP